jgi:hypothetical protein
MGTIKGKGDLAYAHTAENQHVVLIQEPPHLLSCPNNSLRAYLVVQTDLAPPTYLSKGVRRDFSSGVLMASMIR